MSYLKTAILLAGLTGLFMGVGYLMAAPAERLIALVIAAAMNLFAYWNSDRMVLSMYGAMRSTATARPISSIWWPSWPAAPACRCRACSSSTRRSPMRSPPAAIRRTPRSR
jgi:Zn-dependent protease with chaperone function